MRHAACPLRLHMCCSVAPSLWRPPHCNRTTFHLLSSPLLFPTPLLAAVALTLHWSACSRGPPSSPPPAIRFPVAIHCAALLYCTLCGGTQDDSSEYETDSEEEGGVGGGRLLKPVFVPKHARDVSGGRVTKGWADGRACVRACMRVWGVCGWGRKSGGREGRGGGQDGRGHVRACLLAACLHAARHRSRPLSIRHIHTHIHTHPSYYTIPPPYPSPNLPLLGS